MTHITILSRSDCHLCSVIEKMARRLEGDLKLVIDTYDVDTRADWKRAYGEAIPVVLVDGVEACRGKVTEGELRRRIERLMGKARWRRSISRILSRLGWSPRRG